MKIDIHMADEIGKIQSYLDAAPQHAARAMRLALNTVAQRSGMALIRNSIRDQIDFDRNYLTGNRLEVAKRATDNSLSVTIRARKRATSLARFASGQALGPMANGIRVRVKNGKSTQIKRGWLVRLKKGASLTEDNYNVGLAVRLGPGEEIAHKRTAHSSWLVKDQVALLYGPSVDQIFRSVSEQIGEKLARQVAQEFYRQFERL